MTGRQTVHSDEGGTRRRRQYWTWAWRGLCSVEECYRVPGEERQDGRRERGREREREREREKVFFTNVTYMTMASILKH